MTATLDARPSPRSTNADTDQLPTRAPGGLEGSKADLLARMPSPRTSAFNPQGRSKLDKAAMMLPPTTHTRAVSAMRSAARRVSTDIADEPIVHISIGESSARPSTDQAPSTTLPPATPAAPAELAPEPEPTQPDAQAGTPADELASDEQAEERAEATDQVPTLLPSIPAATGSWFARAGLRRRSSTAGSMMLPDLELFGIEFPVPAAEPEADTKQETEVDADEKVKPAVAQAPVAPRTLSQRALRTGKVALGSVAAVTLLALVVVHFTPLPAEVLAAHRAAQGAAAVAALRAATPMPGVAALNAYIASATTAGVAVTTAENVNIAALLAKPLLLSPEECAANSELPAAQILCAAAAIAAAG